MGQRITYDARGRHFKSGHQQAVYSSQQFTSGD